MPWRVDEVDPVTVPAAAHGGGEDGDPAVTLLGVEVGHGRAVMDFAALVGDSGDVQDPFGDGGLAGVDMGEDAQVADAAQGVGENTVQAGTHGTGPFEVIRARTARFPWRTDSGCPYGNPARPGRAGRTAGRGQRLVTYSGDGRAAIAGRPADTRITSYRGWGTATTAR